MSNYDNGMYNSFIIDTPFAIDTHFAIDTPFAIDTHFVIDPPFITVNNPSGMLDNYNIIDDNKKIKSIKTECKKTESIKTELLKTELYKTDKKEKIIIRKIKNRLAAQRSRDNRINYIKILESELRSIIVEKENALQEIKNINEEIDTFLLE